MTTVRIAHAEPQPGDLGNGIFITNGYLVVLADDAGRRVLPVWLRDPSGGSLQDLLEEPALAPEELTPRLLRAAGASVTGVDIDASSGDELDLARIELRGPAGTRQVTTRFGPGLAIAAATGAPVRVPTAVLDRLALDDRPGPGWVPPPGRLMGGRLAGRPVGFPAKRPRFEPRNLAFADGLDRWDLDGGFVQDYSCAVEGQSAILSSAALEPRGSAALMQTIFAEDYHGARVTFRGEIRTARLTYEAGIRLETVRQRQLLREDHGVTVAGGMDWTGHEVTAMVPDDAELIRFGVVLVGPGRIELRGPAFP